MKNRFHVWSDKLFKPLTPISAGMYHFQSPPEVSNPYRLHLRVEPDGKGLLVVNASTVLHLNQTAAEYAYYFIGKKQPNEVGRLMQSRYKIKADQAKLDYETLSTQIQTLLETPDLSPELFINLERKDPYSAAISAPYRLDCALTCKTSSESMQVAGSHKHADRELTTEEWKTILQKAAKAGIPHVIFTGGEPTIRPDLSELIVCTEEMELVCGLISDGTRLTDPAYLHQLLNSGLDHLMLLLDETDSASWEALKDSLSEDIYITVHLTISKKNAKNVSAVIDKLASLSVPSISLSMDSAELAKDLKAAQQHAQQKGIKLVWDLPVPYSSNHPVAVELSENNEYLSGAGKAWLYVEPDGDVLPDQTDTRKLGNLLTDSWEDIWKNR